VDLVEFRPDVAPEAARCCNGTIERVPPCGLGASGGLLGLDWEFL
jgi:hypothetical protein